MLDLEIEAIQQNHYSLEYVDRNSDSSRGRLDEFMNTMDKVTENKHFTFR